MPKIAIETHEFFNLYRKAFGLVHTRKLFGVQSNQTVYKWCADPDFNGETRPNPLDRLESMIWNLLKADEHETAQRLVDRLANIVGCQLVCEDSEPDKPTLNAELLDDLPAIANYHTAIREKRNPVEVRELLRKAKDELSQSYAASLKG